MFIEDVRVDITVTPRIIVCVHPDRYRNTLTRKADYIIPDCIDIQVEVTPVPVTQLSNLQSGEPSSVIRQRVAAARAIQGERFKDASTITSGRISGIHCNAQMTDRMMQEYCALDAASSRLLNTAMERLDLSARAYSRILKVARTIADLEGAPQIQQHHIAEAVGYRNLDRGNWGE